jgi:hypothetical protein
LAGVILGLAVVIMLLAAVAMLWGLLTTVINKPPGRAQLIFAAVVELATVVQTVTALVQLALGFRPAEFATTVGYLVFVILLIPVAWFWANNERTRYSGLVLAVAGASVLVMTFRLLSLWTPAA